MKQSRLSIDQVLEELCYYDSRNPLFVESEEEERPITARCDCFCDNCFYGRDELALEILRLHNFRNMSKVEFYTTFGFTKGQI